MADSDFTATFAAHAQREDEKMASAIGKLDDGTRAILSAVLARFDRNQNQELDDVELDMAYRVLHHMHTLTAKGLDLLLQILAYLDVNGNSVLEHGELTLAVDILEMFCKADSINDTLSQKELQILLLVLESLDSDGNGVLDEDERRALYDGLWDPDAFLKQQADENESIRKLMS